MQMLIVCGSPWCNLDHALAHLKTAGMADPLPAKGGSITTMEEWHRRLFATRTDTAQALIPGRAWELAAGEIFLANWEQTLWGWADSRNSLLLDFWLNFDAQTRFVLIHTPAADALVNAAMQSTAQDFDPAQVLDSWCQHQDRMLQFYLRHRERCAWLLNLQPSQGSEGHAEPAESEASGQLEAMLSGPWPVALNLPSAFMARPQNADPAIALLHDLALKAVKNHAQATALQNEVWASLPDQDSHTPATSHSDVTPRAAELMVMVQQVAVLQVNELQQQLKAARQDHAEASQENTALLAQLEATEKAKSDLGQQLDRAHQDQAEASQENELLLAQLHQVQEELERNFLELSEHKQLLHTETLARQELEAKLKAETQAAQQLQSNLTAETQAQRELQSILKVESQAKQQLQSNLTAETQAKQELQSRLEAESQARQHLQSMLDAETQAKAAALTQCDATEKTRTDLEQQLNTARQAHAEATEENDLLLNQLHQVQEELENYFLKYQEATHLGQQLQERLYRWAQRYPNHCEWDNLTILPNSSAQQQEVIITQLQQAGRNVARLHLQLQNTADHCELIVFTEPDQPTPLMHWPLATEASGEPTPVSKLRINVAAQTGSTEANVLASLAPSDLRLIKAVCTRLASDVPDHDPQPEEWASPWLRMAEAVDQLPPSWRFDAVQLRHEEVHTGYEHLWFKFDQAQFGAQSWPAFEFRLSANDIPEGGFSHLPKLEFPRPEHDGPKPFENWVEEPTAEADPRFELRFDINTPALDINCWNTLNEYDQALVLALINGLHGLLDRLEQSGTHIQRPWADWHLMVSGIQHTLVLCLGIDPQLVGHDASATPAH